MKRTRLLPALLFLFSALLVLGCDDDGDNTPSDADMTGDMMIGDTTDTTDPDSVDPDSVDPDTTDSDTDDAGPVISGLTVTENPNNSLSALIEFTTDVEATVAVDVAGDDGTMRTIDVSDASGTSHLVGVIGLHAETAYTFTVRATDVAGNETVDDTSTFTTTALPEDMPTFTATGEASSPVLMNVFRWSPTPDSMWGMLVIVDEAGEPIWYYRSEHQLGAADARMLDNGTIMFIEHHDRVVQIDMLGDEVASWTTEDLGTDGLHHEAFPLDNGNIAVLGVALHEDVPGYQDENGADVSYDVASDVIIEFDPATGTVVNSFDVFDILDPLVYTDSFHGTYWNPTYAGVSDATKDWSHGNAVVVDPADGNFVVSLRHLNWIIKMDRDDGSLIWKLGPDGDFTMNGTGEWQYHQHAPMFTPSGTMLVYDNGNFRPDTDPFYSRAVEYALDETTMTVDQVWEYRHDPDVYAPFLGDADYLANGNVLVGSGGAVADATLGITDPNNKKYGLIEEVTGDADPQVVFSLEVSSDDIGYSVYRADAVELW